MSHQTNLINPIRLNSIAFFVLCFLIFITCNLFLFPFESPLCQSAPADIGYFMTAGRCVANGMIPYSNVWDIKGPLAFFINALGYLVIPEGKLGPFIISNLLFFLNLPILNYYLKNRYSALFIFVTLWFLCWLWGPSLMFTESFALTFNTLALCIAYHYLTSAYSRKPMTNRKVLLFGLLFGLSSLTKATNGILIFACAIYLMFYYLRKHWVKPLLSAILLFLCVSIGLLLPFIIYFWQNQSLEIFLQGYILDSFIYASNNTSNSSIFSYIKALFYELTFLIPLLILIKKRLYDKRQSTFFATTYIICFLGQNIGGSVPHYIIAYAPLYALVLKDFYKYLLTSMQSLRIVKILTVSLLLLLSYSKILLTTGWNTLTYSQYGKKIVDASLQAQAYLESKNAETVIAYNVDPTFYVVTNRLPALTYFANQDQNTPFHPQIQPYFQNAFINEIVDYVLIPNENTFANALTQQCLQSHYHHADTATGTNYKNDTYALLIYEANRLTQE